MDALIKLKALKMIGIHLLNTFILPDEDYRELTGDPEDRERTSQHSTQIN